MAQDQPDINHLDVRGGGKALHLADEDGSHHQHGGQVHAKRAASKKKGLKKVVANVINVSNSEGK